MPSNFYRWWNTCPHGLLFQYDHLIFARSFSCLCPICTRICPPIRNLRTSHHGSRNLATIPFSFLVNAPSNSLKISDLKAYCFEYPKFLSFSQKNLTSSSFHLVIITNKILCLDDPRWFTQSFALQYWAPWSRYRFLRCKVFGHLMSKRMLLMDILFCKSILNFWISGPKLGRCCRQIHLRIFPDF